MGVGDLLRLKAILGVHAAIVIFALASLAWLYLGRRVRGADGALWLAVPLLLDVAVICIAGPGHLYSKRYEGSILVELARHSGITIFDVTGLALATLAAALGGFLLWRCWPQLQWWGELTPAGDSPAADAAAMNEPRTPASR
ncbi:MAG TPA: hypothetical protein VFU72_12370 [Nitrolancea sp.]|nr:hypothetical protein [Nitrolancea sp.]